MTDHGMAPEQNSKESGLHAGSRTKLLLEWLNKKTILVVLCLALLAFLVILLADDTAAWLHTEVETTTAPWAFSVFVSETCFRQEVPGGNPDGRSFPVRV